MTGGPCLRRVARRRRLVTRLGDRGAAALEFALVLPILMLLILGCVDWGWYFFVDQIVANAAREGARRGAVSDEPGFDPCAEAEAGSKAYLLAAELKAAESDSSVVTPHCDYSPGVMPSVQVTITYPVGSITGFLPRELVPSFAKSVATMRIE